MVFFPLVLGLVFPPAPGQNFISVHGGPPFWFAESTWHVKHSIAKGAYQEIFQPFLGKYQFFQDELIVHASSARQNS